MKMTRRQFLKTASALVAAPAIVKAENLMPIVPPKEIETLGSVDVWVSDFGMMDVIKDATMYGQGMAIVTENGIEHVPVYSNAVGRPRKPIQRRTAEQALEAALQDAWKRGADPSEIRMSDATLDFFRRSHKYA